MRFVGRLAVMSVLGCILFWLISVILPAAQKSKIGIWEVYIVGVLIPYSVGAFVVFAFGDWVCLKLRLYKDNEVYGLYSSLSFMSEISRDNINETR